MEEKRPERYLSMKEMSWAAAWDSDVDEEGDSALTLSLSRSWDTIWVQASSASCCAKP